MKIKPISDRISAAIKANGGQIKYYDLAQVVFPRDHYPQAYGSPTRGGPPGCYMALSRAIREHGFRIDHREAVVHSIVSMGRYQKGTPNDH